MPKGWQPTSKATTSGAVSKIEPGHDIGIYINDHGTVYGLTAVLTNDGEPVFVANGVIGMYDNCNEFNFPDQLARRGVAPSAA